jgi:hypothetical protein
MSAPRLTFEQQHLDDATNAADLLDVLANGAAR